MGITFPVRVRPATHFTERGMAGKYHGLGYWGPTSEERLNEPAHHISLRADMDAGFANVTLWHEMTHAAQCEDYLPETEGEGDYRIANAGLRQAFAKEMREIRRAKGIKTRGVTADYGNVSFEVEARDVMDGKDNFDIVEPIGSEANAPAKDDPMRGFSYRWRVDAWDDNKEWVGTYYVLTESDQPWDAKRWVRDNPMKDMKWSNNLNAYPVPPLKKEGVKA